MAVEQPKEQADLASEAAVIGSMMLNEAAITKANAMLASDDFYWPKHQILFSGVTALYLKKGKYDTVMLRARLEIEGTIDEVGGAEYIAKLLQAVPSAANITHYCEIVKKHSDARKLKIISEQIAKITDRADIEPAEKLSTIEALVVSAKGEQQAAGKTIFKTADKDLVAVVDSLGEEYDGVPLGFNDLDFKLHGFAKGSFNIIAGRPSMGKTGLMCNIAYNIAQTGRNVVIYSLEMTWRMLTQRMLCSIGGINIYDLKRLRKDDSPDLWDKITESAEQLQAAPVFIIDKGITNISDLMLSVKAMKREYDIDIIFVDYIQLLEAKRKTENRQQEITTISRRLKALAKEEDIPLVALSQLNRGVEGRNIKKPLLSDLRESGSLEQDADVVMFIYRKDYYKKDETGYVPDGIADILISKNRNGATGSEKMFFAPQFVRFTNYMQGYENYNDGQI